MTSGEWDLNALQALEEEEQKEFLALSQKNLFDPPILPVATAHIKDNSNNLVTHQHQQLIQTINANAQQSTQQQQYKLPTISEWQAAITTTTTTTTTTNIKKSNSGSATPSSLPSTSGLSVLSAARLKLTRALSLSAHSLNAGYRTNSNSGNVNGKKSPTSTAAKRYATLHHAQPVRRTFQTLHQMEQQTRKNQRNHNRHLLVATHKSPSLRRVAGTNKTYWQYGPTKSYTLTDNRSFELESQNSEDIGSDDVNDNVLGARASFSDAETETASCSVPLLGDSVEMMRYIFNAAHTAVNTLPQMTLTHSNCSSISDNNNQHNNNNNNNNNNAISTGVQQLSAITTTTTTTTTLSQRISGSCYTPLTATATAKPTTTTTNTYNPNETVAYEAFNIGRRKSFSNPTTSTLYDIKRPTHNMTSTIMGGSGGGGGAVNKSTMSYNIINNNNNNNNNRKRIYKSGSLDMDEVVSHAYANDYVAYGDNNNYDYDDNNKNGFIREFVCDAGIRPTIIKNPIMNNNNNNNNNNVVRCGMEGLIMDKCYIPTTTPYCEETNINNKNNNVINLTGLKSYKNMTRSTLNLPTATTTITNKFKYQQPTIQYNDYQQQHYNRNNKYVRQLSLSMENYDNKQSFHQHHVHQQHAMDIDEQQQQQQQQQQQHLCLEHHHNNNGDFIDDLEQHIKNCNCSCNHMGYGNSMDYQVSIENK